MRVYDILTPRRLITTAVILLAAVVTVYGFQHVKDTRQATCGGGTNPAIVLKRYFPCPGDSDLNQSRIGVSVEDGYTAQLYVDGTFIPEDELSVEGALVTFTPGPGTITGALAPGPHTASANVYKLLADPATGTRYNWTFSIT